MKNQVGRPWMTSLKVWFIHITCDICTSRNLIHTNPYVCNQCTNQLNLWLPLLLFYISPNHKHFLIVSAFKLCQALIYSCRSDYSVWLLCILDETKTKSEFISTIVSHIQRQMINKLFLQLLYILSSLHINL